MELGMSCCRGIQQAIHTYPFLPNKVHLCFYNLIPSHTYTQHHVITTSNSMNIKQECSDVWSYSDQYMLLEGAPILLNLRVKFYFGQCETQLYSYAQMFKNVNNTYI